MKRYAFLLLSFLCCAASAAPNIFYVDSRFTGTPLGTQSNPWVSLNWTTLNTVLATNDATVFLSALTAGGVTEAVYSATGSTSQADGIDGNSLTANAGHRLYIDGTSYYNSNNTTPLWLVNPFARTIADPSTGRACWVKYFLTQNDGHAKRNNITIFGLHLATPADNKAFSLCGDNLYVLACEAEDTAHVASGGPLGLLVPTADAAHEGSSAYAPKCTNIIIMGNHFHDSQGELVYLGGGGSNPGQAGSGYPSHDQITVSSNRLHRSAIFGDQGDAIDKKGGLTNTRIEHNEIFDLGKSSDSPVRGIVTQGLYDVAANTNYIRWNRIYGITNIDDAPIAVVNSFGSEKDLVVGGNVIYACTRSGNTVGVKSYGTTGTLYLLNNTIVGMENVGFYLETGTTLYSKNNFLSGNNGGASQVDYRSSTVTASDYNAYVGSSWGYGSEGVHTISTTALLNFVNAATNNYNLITNAVVASAGVAVTGVPTDFNGATYLDPPSIGAFSPTTTPPVPPVTTNTTIVTGKTGTKIKGRGKLR